MVFDGTFDFTVTWRGYLVYSGMSMSAEQVLDVLGTYLTLDDSIEMDGRTMPAEKFIVHVSRRLGE